MDAQEEQLDRLLDCWTAPLLEHDLSTAILARAATEDKALDDLLDRAFPAATLNRDLTDQIMARCHRDQEQALDRLLDAADPVPPMQGDLVAPVLRRIRRGRLFRRVAGLAGSLAAAAAIAIVALVLHGRPGTTTVAGPIAPADQPVVANLDLLDDFAVLRHWDTIRAMEQLEEEDVAGDSL